MTLVAAVFAPSGMFAKVPSIVGMLLLSIAVVPCVFVAASMGRETRKGMARIEAGVKERALRPATLVFVAMVMASFAPVVAAMLTATGMKPFGDAVNVTSLLSPLHLVIALGRDVLGLQIPAGTGTPPGVWLVLMGLTAQAALAALARLLERRSTATDDFAYTAPPGE